MLSFNVRDWWQPTSANYFNRLKKEKIAGDLTNNGFTGPAREVLGMKKKDAAILAEELIGKTTWVPDCMTASVPDVEVNHDSHAA